MHRHGCRVPDARLTNTATRHLLYLKQLPHGASKIGQQVAACEFVVFV
jgi:hypothetical protein